MERKLIELIDKALTRRSFMAGSGAAAAVTVVAGCGGGMQRRPRRQHRHQHLHPVPSGDTDYLKFRAEPRVS